MSSKTDTRTKILAATWSLIQKSGAEKVRMADIAKHAEISRQAIYLHFENKTDLLIGTTGYLDELLNMKQLYSKVRKKEDGIERLDAFIQFWGNYIPKIYEIARALMVAKDSDIAAKTAWDERMYAVRNGCREVIGMLDSEGKLSEDWSVRDATSFLWTMVSIPNWEQLTRECRWSNSKYVSSMQFAAHRVILKQ